ncbi:MAG: PLP-dependent aspartate aminotransferase family protein [Actinomycetota bacterium]|nr:PLP-dependent aspartate aminotransferase family protein [Actinomycetota bacterium]
MRLDLSTLAVHAGRPDRYPGAPLSVPPTMSSTYVAGTPRIYAREEEAASQAFEEAVGALEGGRAIAFASGVAAAAAVLAVAAHGLRRPLRVVAQSGMYTGNLGLLRSEEAAGHVLLAEVDAVTADDILPHVAQADLVWVETPSNPLLRLYDIEILAAACRAGGAKLCVDSTFATPVLQNPLALGADLVVHSASKYLGGHSDLIAGVAVTADASLGELLHAHRTRYGSTLGPMESFLALRGLRTLALRVERASDNAAALAAMLEGHPVVGEVYYPGLASSPYRSLAERQMRKGGAMLSIVLPGAPYLVERFCDSLRIAVNSTSLGGVETQVERRAKHPGEVIDPGLVRVSVGIEDIGDLLEDFRSALEAAYRAS